MPETGARYNSNVVLGLLVPMPKLPLVTFIQESWLELGLKRIFALELAMRVPVPS